MSTTFNSFPFLGKKITENPASDALTGAEILVLVQGDVSKKITVSDLLTYLSGVTVPNANHERLGIVRLSKAPVNANAPIAVGTNDERVAATGVAAGTYGDTKLLTVEVDVYGKIKSISERTFSVAASDVSGLSVSVQTIGDEKYILKTESVTTSIWVPDRSYKINELVVRTGKLFRSKEAGNIGNDPLTSNKWEKIGGGDATVITKAGSDVDGDGNLNLSTETIPENPKPTVYVDDVTGSWAVQFNKSTKVLTGLYGIDAGAVIEIIF